MTTKETIEALRNSDIWQCLSAEEKLDAISYALVATGSRFHMAYETAEISDVIGETYSG